MKYCYLLSLLFLICSFSQASDPVQGYLITKNGKKLTGKIGEIYFNQHGSQLVFMNDFGNVYNIHCALIRGFALQKGADMIYYETRYLRNTWYFMLVLYKGEQLSLYKAPQVHYEDYGPISLIKHSHDQPTQFWIENQHYRMSKINRIGFRRKMRKLLKQNAPELAEKIGQPGYRYKNLVKIVDEFNQICQKNRKLL